MREFRYVQRDRVLFMSGHSEALVEECSDLLVPVDRGSESEESVGRREAGKAEVALLQLKMRG